MLALSFLKKTLFGILTKIASGIFTSSSGTCKSCLALLTVTCCDQRSEPSWENFSASLSCFCGAWVEFVSAVFTSFELSTIATELGLSGPSAWVSAWVVSVVVM